MPIRLLKFITLFAVGGTERQFVYLTRALDRSQFDLRVGCFEKTGTFLEDVESLNVPILEYRTTSLYSPRTLRNQLQLAAYIRKQGIQVIHTYGHYPNVFAIPAARLAGNCVTIASVRDTGVFSSQKRMKAAAQRVACALADCVLANSNAVRDWLISEGIAPAKIRVIPNGIVVPRHSEAHSAAIREEFAIEPDAPIVAVVCRLNSGKGLEYFLDAVPSVRERFPNARFMIIGDSIVEPEYKGDLQQYAHRLNISDRVIFTGERSDVSAILGQVTMSVLPSLSEGLSNSLMEAMAAGLPVVATDVGGNPEIVSDGETGILVPPKDAAALSQAMIRVLESSELARRFGEAGRERVMRNFSLESTVKQTEELYRNLLGRRKHDLQDLPAAAAVT
jgi:L-malate glycosyltransferase